MASHLTILSVAIAAALLGACVTKEAAVAPNVLLAVKTMAAPSSTAIPMTRCERRPSRSRSI